MAEILGVEVSETKAVSAEERLRRFRELLAVYDAQDRAELMDGYYQMLCDWNSRMNLTGNTDFEVILTAHIADSLSPLGNSELFHPGSTVIDVGSGAGFPGLPLAIARGDLHVTLLDSLQKRVSFLQAVKDSLGLENISLLWSRAEDAARNPIQREQYDMAVARAVAPCNVLCELLLPFVRKGGQILCYKGPAAEEEMAVAKRASFLLGGGHPMLRTVEVFGAPQLSHCVFICEKRENTPRAYPRKTGTPQKKPIGV